MTNDRIDRSCKDVKMERRGKIQKTEPGAPASQDDLPMVFCGALTDLLIE